VTSGRSVEKADEDAGSGPDKAHEESHESDQPLSPERVNISGAGESDRAATCEKPAAKTDEDAGSSPDKADEDGRQQRRPWLLQIELLVITLLVSGTSGKSVEKADEDAGSGPDKADEESRESDQPVSAELVDISGAGESDRTAASGKPAAEADEDAGSQGR